MAVDSSMNEGRNILHELQSKTETVLSQLPGRERGLDSSHICIRRKEFDISQESLEPITFLNEDVTRNSMIL